MRRRRLVMTSFVAASHPFPQKTLTLSSVAPKMSSLNSLPHGALSSTPLPPTQHLSFPLAHFSSASYFPPISPPVPLASPSPLSRALSLRASPVCGHCRSLALHTTPPLSPLLISPLRCGHCKSLAPTWEELADAFAKTPSVVIASVDADAHKSLGGRFGVTGFPTLKYFPKVLLLFFSSRISSCLSSSPSVLIGCGLRTPRFPLFFSPPPQVPPGRKHFPLSSSSLLERPPSLRFLILSSRSLSLTLSPRPSLQSPLVTRFPTLKSFPLSLLSSLLSSLLGLWYRTDCPPLFSSSFPPLLALISSDGPTPSSHFFDSLLSLSSPPLYLSSSSLLCREVT